MSIIKKDLNDSEVANSNPTIGYFPARTNPKEGAFDWEIAMGIVVRNLFNKAVSKDLMVKAEDGEPYGKFKELCKEKFEQRLDEPKMWEHLESMYFSSDAFFKIAPECLLFKILPGFTSSKNPLGDLFSSLMQDYYNGNPERIKRNFLEQQLVDTLRSERVLKNHSGSRYSKNIEEEPYLPFLQELFCQDIKFLSDHPKYLIQNLEEFLKLYGYLYTAQLALNIGGFTDEPFVRPVYFILENETASVERTDLVKKGHQGVSKSLGLIFPYLTMSEAIQDVAGQGRRIPIWSLLKQLRSEDVAALKTYAAAFAEQREIEFGYDTSNSDVQYWLNSLMQLSSRQFDPGESRASAHAKFLKSTETELCSTFVRSRGRVGKILVMNQDYLSLLTNLCIGQNDRLRFHDLVDAFSARGVFFDKRTQQALIKFYERVGNVERMSDSGDAVYVRKTV